MAPDQVVYHRFPPPPSAHGIVEHLWVVRVPAGHVEREVLLPDGHGLVTVAVGTAGVHIDPLTLARTADGSGVRGLAVRAFVREQPGPSVRLGAQLDPVALARMGVHAGAPESVAVSAVLGAGVEEQCATALGQGRDAHAAAILGEDLAAHAVPARVGSPLEALTRCCAASSSSAVSCGRRTWPDAPTSLSACCTASSSRRSGSPRRRSSRRCGSRRSCARPSVRVSSGRMRSWRCSSGTCGPGTPREVERFTGLEPAELRRLAGHAVGSLVDG